MRRDEHYVELSALRTFAAGLDHPEGICATPDGSIYASGEAGQLYRVADGVAHEVLSTDGFLLGLAADGEGFIYACDNARECVWRIDPNAGSAEVFLVGSAAEPLRAPNWGAFAPDCRYFLSDSGGWKEGNGKIWVVGAGGEPAVWSRESRDFPNGVAFTPDASELWVLESTPPRLVAIPVEADGSAGPRRVVAELPGTVPDGLAFAEDGSVLIACYRPDVVLRWHPDSGLGVLAEDPEGTALAAPTNLIFVGSERRTVVVPNIGRWHLTSFETPLVGVPPFFPARTPQEKEDH